MLQVYDPATPVIVPFILGIIGEVFIGDVDLVPVRLVVREFVDSVGDGIGLYDEEQRRVGAA